jgi:very-short-patch-repair endonuclease
MAGSSPESALAAALVDLRGYFSHGGRSLINIPRVPSNGLSPHVAPYDLTGFHRAVQKALQKLQLFRDGFSIEPIIKKIADWDSPPEQVFYVSFIYLTNAEVIDPMIRLVEQYPISNGRVTYRVDFRLSLVDHLKPKLPPITLLVECDSDQFHHPILERSTERCQRSRAIERQGTKVYRFSGTEVLKHPETCIIECAMDLQQLVNARREMLMRFFL